MNNYICKKFISNRKINITNIETNKILNYCKYFLLSRNEYFNYFLKNTKYQYFWLLRVPQYNYSYTYSSFTGVNNYGDVGYSFASYSCGFIPFFLQERKLKNENYKNF